MKKYKNRINTITAKIEMVKRELTQTQLAKMSGIGMPTLNKALNGNTCSSETISKIANALNVPVDRIIQE